MFASTWLLQCLQIAHHVVQLVVGQTQLGHGRAWLSSLRVVHPLLEELRVIGEVVVLLSGDVSEIGADGAYRALYTFDRMAGDAALAGQQLIAGVGVALLEWLGAGLDAHDACTCRTRRGV